MPATDNCPSRASTGSPQVPHPPNRTKSNQTNRTRNSGTQAKNPCKSTTPDAERLDAVLAALGFTRRNPLQHIWFHPRLIVAVQVPASFLPRHSATQDVQAPNGTTVTVWSPTDLILDRLAQAVFGGAPDRLDQALALRLVTGDEFESSRARERARDEGPQMQQALGAFLRLYAALGTGGPEDAGAADDSTRVFWSEVDALGLRR
jgi:hypothetical protein